MRIYDRQGPTRVELETKDAYASAVSRKLVGPVHEGGAWKHLHEEQHANQLLPATGRHLMGGWDQRRLAEAAAVIQATVSRAMVGARLQRRTLLRLARFAWLADYRLDTKLQ